ncbi:SMI1/KNR4 family protein [Mesorhizobium sp. ASY16-5R]|uniref:SMI1/KNR4 family protein n=1 Tax=Mesorhizobium sp. ASY16-5R TaxID=3445772 RepID=UPI003F9F86E5
MAYNFTEGRFEAPPHPDVIERLSAKLGGTLPGDYLALLRQHNGGEGFIGDNYIVFWKVEELADFNREYEVEIYAPGIFLFGSNGGGEGYGFDTQSRAMPIVQIPFVGMERQYATPVAKDIADLFAKLAMPL